MSLSLSFFIIILIIIVIQRRWRQKKREAKAGRAGEKLSDYKYDLMKGKVAVLLVVRAPELCCWRGRRRRRREMFIQLVLFFFERVTVLRDIKNISRPIRHTLDKVLCTLGTQWKFYLRIFWLLKDAYSGYFELSFLFEF